MYSEYTVVTNSNCIFSYEHKRKLIPIKVQQYITYTYSIWYVIYIAQSVDAVNPINSTLFESEIRFDGNGLPTQPKPLNCSSQNADKTITE